MLVDSYTVASLIKYPHKLYSYQKKEIYLPILESAIAEDSKQFKDYLNIDLIDQKELLHVKLWMKQIETAMFVLILQIFMFRQFYSIKRNERYC